jgi:hypothetical protein
MSAVQSRASPTTSLSSMSSSLRTTAMTVPTYSSRGLRRAKDVRVELLAIRGDEPWDEAVVVLVPECAARMQGPERPINDDADRSAEPLGWIQPADVDGIAHDPMMQRTDGSNAPARRSHAASCLRLRESATPARGAPCSGTRSRGRRSRPSGDAVTSGPRTTPRGRPPGSVRRSQRGTFRPISAPSSSGASRAPSSWRSSCWCTASPT